MTLGKHEFALGYYCGPASIALLTGKTYTDIRKAINQIRGTSKENQGICGVSLDCPRKAMELLGYKVVESFIAGKPVPLRHMEFKGYWIVRSSGHLMAVVDNEVADNQTPIWLPIQNSRLGGRRITHGWRFE